MNGYLYRVKINSDFYACFVYSDDSAELKVEEELPTANTIDDLIKCDDSSFGDTNDGIISGWNFNEKINEILSGNENLDVLSLTFHISSESANDLNDNGITNTENYTNENSPNEQEIFVRVRNNETDCFNAETSFKVIVEPLPVANDVTISRQCDGDAGDESQDGLYPFDTSNIQTTLLAGQTEVTTYYYYKDADDNDVLIGNELPNPFVSGSQIITIQVENNTPQKCYDETTLEFIVDDSPETYAVVIDSQCDDGPSDIDGYSEFNTSTITQTLLTSDNNNTITIDTANLGIGDYEFAIDDPNGPYQNDPFFENVRPGIHTIYIRDRNDCGIAQIDVSVIGYKKFFTPNGDGIHDNWRILGIREDFQPNSRVYIFDRYGKLLKELDPVTEGWDGTYLGRPMPQTDYWFRVFLEDGREFKGHFSLVRGRNGGNN